MKKIAIGICGGIIGAVINILFLLLAPGLDIKVYISTAVTWLVIGIFISSCSFKLNGILKGIIISILVSASSLIYTAASSVSSTVWTLIPTVIIGAVMGYAIEKVICLTGGHD